MTQLTPEELAAFKSNLPNWEGVPLIVETALRDGFKWGLSHARAESAKEIADLQSGLETAHQINVNQLSEIADLKAQVKALYSAALWGISHVGTANYQHRQNEAIRRVQEIRYPAIAQEKSK